MIYYAASDLPDEWRSPPGTRGANARLGTFRQLTGHNMPDISSFTIRVFVKGKLLYDFVNVSP